MRDLVVLCLIMSDQTVFLLLGQGPGPYFHYLRIRNTMFI